MPTPPKHLTIPIAFLFLTVTTTAIVTLAEENSPDVTASITKADGLESVEFDTLNGVVQVDLPDDLSETDTISGSVIAEPKGETKEEIAQNEDTLNGYIVEIEQTQEVQEPEPKHESKPIHDKPAQSKPHESKQIQDKPTGSKPHESAPIICEEPPAIYTVPHHRNGFSCHIPRNHHKVNLVMKDHHGRVICSKAVTCNPTPPPKPPRCTIPASGTCGKSLCIPGPFDGRTRTANVAVSGQSCTPVAISPRKYIASMPTNTPGQCSISVTNHGQVTRGSINLAPAKYVQPKSSSTSAKRLQAQPSATTKYYFRRSGPFVTDNGPAKEHSVQITQDPHSQLITITWRGPSVHDREGQTSTGTFTYNPPPEIVRIGDKINFSCQVTGDRHYDPDVSITCGSPWVKLLTPVTNFTKEGTIGTPSGVQTYQIVDAKKLTDDYYKQHPEMTGKYPPLDENFQFWVLAGGPRGYCTLNIYWKYTMTRE